MNLITNENLFLIILGLVWIIGAVLMDAKRREVDNVWNFSLIGIALAYRGFLSVFYWNSQYILNGLIGFGFFYIIANLFYYSRMFAGGDAKLLMGLGPVLPFSLSWLSNLKFFGSFIILFLVSGSIYALFFSIILIFKNSKNFKEEFVYQLVRYKKFFLVPIILAILLLVFGLIIGQSSFIFISVILFLAPWLFVFSKAVEESCMIQKVMPDKVTEGDWLYKDIFIGKKKIRSDWEGVSKRELKIIRRSRKPILIKQGIPFTPSFLIGYLVLIFLMWQYGWIFFINLI